MLLLKRDMKNIFVKLRLILFLEAEGKTVKLAKTMRCRKLLDEEGCNLTDPFNGGVLIDVSVHEHLITPVPAISSKVILYNKDQVSDLNSRRVINFLRGKIPISLADITVPFFPQINDMIFIRKEDPDP